MKRAQMQRHAYLARKGFPELEAATSNAGETLLVAMYDSERKLCNVQMIAGKAPKSELERARQKLFLPRPTPIYRILHKPRRTLVRTNFT